ncbi:hypothetical protein [Miltoncostaea oceani]|uniref:hypothetical protein n=1 Tax=Miltoncostaea oceani TaxID=2843216 RepID=UPI001C3E46B9|nr:hypothetical protein [Miltoncostaea oceani]
MERELQLGEGPFRAEANRDPQIPKALLPRAADSELAQRATALADRVAGYGASARLDGRFRLAVGDLGRVVVGLEGMRACGLAPAVADQALPQLAEVLDAVEQALDEAAPELQAELRDAEAAREPVRRPRRPRAAAAK